MAGDKIDILDKSYYFEASTGAPAGTNEQMITEILSGLLGTPGGVVNTSGHGPVTTTILNGQSATTGGINTMLNQQATNTGNYDPEPPKAFINYIFFDEQFKYVSGGFSGVGTQNQLKDHFLQNLAAQKNGYVYIYISNQSPIKVFFDNLQVVHKRGVILEETHYYPFGLTMSGISSKAMSFAKENKKGYVGNELQNKEFSDGSGLDVYDFNARTFDQQIGRFIQVDPFE
ncbi:MAG: hypothetical protein IPH18_00015 [Chitinophagaceae bacterium]|nr:hypothetical protein [Chitinophagaceae bacterium]